MTDRDKIISECQKQLVKYAFTSHSWSKLEDLKDYPIGKKKVIRTWA